MIRFVRFGLSLLIACLSLGLTTLVLAREPQPSSAGYGPSALLIEGGLGTGQATGLAPPGNAQLAASTTVMTIIAPSTIYDQAPTFFTVITSVVLPLPRASDDFYVTWYFGDDKPPEIGNPGITYTYSDTNLFTTTREFTITAVGLDANNQPVTAEKMIMVMPLPEHVYLPIVMKGAGPDLTCSLEVEPPGKPSEADTILFTVEITNANGTADGFWVDLYINPVNEPPQVNETWGQNCGTPCRGIAWAISDRPLGPNKSRRLVSVRSTEHPNGYHLDHTNWPGSLPPGSYKIYALVDSLSLNRADPNGAVIETDETNNVCQLDTLEVVPAVMRSPTMNGQSNLPPRSEP
jgi:hypothetical protein